MENTNDNGLIIAENDKDAKNSRRGSRAIWTGKIDSRLKLTRIRNDVAERGG